MQLLDNSRSQKKFERHFRTKVNVFPKEAILRPEQCCPRYQNHSRNISQRDILYLNTHSENSEILSPIKKNHAPSNEFVVNSKGKESDKKLTNKSYIYIEKDNNYLQLQKDLQKKSHSKLIPFLHKMEMQKLSIKDQPRENKTFLRKQYQMNRYDDNMKKKIKSNMIINSFDQKDRYLI